MPSPPSDRWELRATSIAFALTGLVFTVAYIAAMDEIGPVGPGAGVAFWIQVAFLLAFLLHFSYVARLWRLASRLAGFRDRQRESPSPE
jgi:hypothetical protein